MRANLPLGRAAAIIALATAAFVLLRPTPARADCNGPAECCNTDPTHVTVALPEHIRVGMRLTHVHAISEHDGVWNGELDLVVRWPAGGLRPDLNVRNASGDLSIAVDETTRNEDQCYRERRLSGAFANWFRLRRFPFDRQLLRVLLEERALTDAQAVWEPDLWPNVIAIDAYRELPGWSFADLPQLEVKRSSFVPYRDALHPRLLIVSVPVVRLWQFYLTRYFLPLFLIVALAYGLFWIRPDDLGSASSIGITCMLAIIAFQLTQAGTLPQVAYLTLADRVYVVCYLATALALILAVWESHLAAHDRLELARRLDWHLRRWFPVAFGVAVIAAAVLGWQSHSENQNADIPYIVPEAHPPPGEHAIHS